MSGRCVMNLSEIRDALDLLTQLAEGSAEKVMDVTMGAKDSDANYEFIGFASRKNVLMKVQPDDNEEITKLLDSLHAALAQRINTGKPLTLWWRLKPEAIISSNGFRIGCRLKVTPAVALPKLVVANG